MTSDGERSVRQCQRLARSNRRRSATATSIHGVRMTDEPAVDATLPNGGTLAIQRCLGSVLDEIETQGQLGAFLVGLSTGHAGSRFS